MNYGVFGMKFDEVLTKAIDGEISREEALFLLEEAKTTNNCLELFKAASHVRKREVGEVFKFDGFIGACVPCTTSPPCKYCGRSARSDSFSDVLSPDEIALGARLIEATGTRRVEVGGGTLWSGADDLVLRIVDAVRAATKLDVWVNVGPCLSRGALETLKGLGVIEVCSSLETINEKVFREAKPGDSLHARMEFAKAIKDVGLKLNSVMMVGIGSSHEDYINHIFWLKEVGVDHFCITGFNPIPGTPFEIRTPALSSEVAKVIAVSRLVLKRTDIGIGGIMNDLQLLPLAIMAGANRAIHLGAHVHRLGGWTQKQRCVELRRFNNLEFVNLLPLTVRIARDMGMRAEDGIEKALGGVFK
jgi:biotin synthase